MKKADLKYIISEGIKIHKHLNTLIFNLRQELTEKEEIIDDLLLDLESKNRDIECLENKLSINNVKYL